MNITTTITQKGQITIPKFIRDFLGLSASDSLVVTLEGRKIVATPVKRDFLTLYGSVKHKGKIPDLKKLRQQTMRKMAENAANEGI